jgi:hypothetical protein
MVYGWFCQSLDKSMSTLLLCREVFIYENFIRRQENVTQISCKIETMECMIHFVVCIMTGPWLLPKRVLHRVRTKLFLFQLPMSSLSLKSIQQLLTSSSSFSGLFDISFNSVFYNAVPTQDLTNPVSLLSFLLYIGQFSHNFACCFVWVWSLVADIEGRT